MTMSRRTIAGQPRIPGSGILISIALVFLVRGLLDQATAQTTQHQIQRFNITILSTMLVGDTIGIGEWGFAALVDVDGHRILVDTGAHPDTVIRNAHDLHIDLSDVQEVILTHYHWDHVSGLLMLRRELMKHNPKALSIVHVSDGIFDSRPSETGERNQMIAIRKEYEATGGGLAIPPVCSGRTALNLG